MKNRDRIRHATSLVEDSLRAYAIWALTDAYGNNWPDKVATAQSDPQDWDLPTLTRIVSQHWSQVFHKHLGGDGRRLIGEIHTLQEQIAQSPTFDLLRTQRALDAAARLLQLLGAEDEARKIEQEVAVVMQQRLKDDTPIASEKPARPPAKQNIFGSAKRLLRGEEVADERDLTPLELRTRMLDEVTRTMEPHRKTSPLPFNRVTVHVMEPVAADRLRYQTAIEDLDPPFEQAVRSRLREAGIQLPAAFDIAHALHETPPERLRSAFEKYGAIYVEPEKKTRASAATLAVERGQATRPRYTIQSTGRTNIGRMEQIADQRGRIFRTNHVAFLDPTSEAIDEDERALNATVSREHAYITFDAATARFLWHNEKGSTSINRASYARPMPVGRQPVPLEDGDQLYLGEALLVFNLAPDTETDSVQ